MHETILDPYLSSNSAYMVTHGIQQPSFQKGVLTFRLLVPLSSREVRGCTDLGEITASRVDLLDMGHELATVVDKVLDMAVQVQDPVHVLFVARYIRALVT